MRKPLAFLFVLAVGVFTAALVSAGPGLGISKTAPITGTGSSGDPLKITACSSGSSYESNGSTWACAVHGDVTGVTAGSGLTGTATTGTASLAVGAGAGLAVAADAVSLRTDCADGEVLVSGGTGTTWTCAAAGGSYTAGDGLLLTGSDFDVTPGTGINITSDAVTLNMTAQDCAVGSYLDNVTAVGVFGCVAEVGDISAITVTAPIYGAASSGAAALGLTNCAATEIYKMNAGGTAWECSAAGGSYTAGDGLTLTASDFDIGAGTNITVNANDVALSTNVAIGGTLSVSSGAATVSDFRGTIITPASVSGTVNDWAPTGLSTATAIELVASSAPSMTGLTGGAEGRVIDLINRSGFSMYILHENASSTAANRYAAPNAATWTVPSGDTIRLRYSASRWVVMSNVRFPSLISDGALTAVGATTCQSTLDVSGVSSLGDATTDATNIFGKIYSKGTAPTLSTCTASCSIDAYSTDARGVISCTDDSTANCTVTFANAYDTNAPACIVQTVKATAVTGAVPIISISTSALVFDQTTTGTHSYVYHCDGML